MDPQTPHRNREGLRSWEGTSAKTGRGRTPESFQTATTNSRRLTQVVDGRKSDGLRDGAEVYERRKKVSRTERKDREERKGEQPTETGDDGDGRPRRKEKEEQRRSRRIREIRERKKDIDRKVNRRKKRGARVCARREGERRKLADERSGKGEESRRSGERARRREEKEEEEEIADVGEAARRLWWGWHRQGRGTSRGGPRVGRTGRGKGERGGCLATGLPAAGQSSVIK